jgi:hypothetical protein
MSRMPFRSILHDVLDLEVSELRRVITVGLAGLRHAEVAQWRHLLVDHLAERPSTDEPDPHEEEPPSGAGRPPGRQVRQRQARRLTARRRRDHSRVPDGESIRRTKA